MGISLHLGRHSGAFLLLSKKQTITADSSTVTEFVATHSAFQKILWAQNLLRELRFLSSIPTILYQDNQSTIRLILHKGNSGRIKDIVSRYNMIRECVKNYNINIKYIPTNHMIADTLTKPLGATLFPIHQLRILNSAPPQV